MAVTTETAIANGALRLLGAERINDLSDNNNRARVMLDAYPVERDALLHSHPWKFSTSYSALAIVTPKPIDIFDYNFVFQLPSDCTRVFSTSIDPSGRWEEIEGRRIATDEPAISIKFGKRVTDVTKYSESFVKALMAKLAYSTAYAFSQSTAQVDGLEKMFDRELRAARTFNAQSGGSVVAVVADDWLNSRRW